MSEAKYRLKPKWEHLNDGIYIHLPEKCTEEELKKIPSWIIDVTEVYEKVEENAIEFEVSTGGDDWYSICVKGEFRKKEAEHLKSRLEALMKLDEHKWKAIRYAVSGRTEYGFGPSNNIYRNDIGEVSVKEYNSIYREIDTILSTFEGKEEA